MTAQLSCLPDQLYRDGGFYDDPGVLAELRGRTNTTGFITDVGELWPGFESRRNINGNVLAGRPAFIDTLVSHYEWVNDVFINGAASRVTRLRDVYLLNSVIYRIVHGEVIQLYETARPIDRPYSPAPSWTAEELRAAATHIEVSQVPLYLGSAGSSNYRHWLIDDLPRAASVQAILDTTGPHDVEYLIPGFDQTLNQLKTDSLFALGLAAPGSVIRFIPNDAVLHFDRIYYATPVSYHPTLKSPQAIRTLRERGRAYPFASPHGGDRIYLQNGAAAGSSITNQREVATVFRSFGFTTLDVRQMSFGQQLSAVRRARVVAGPIGEALTNVVFCEPGAVLLQLAPEGETETFYWDLAHAAEHTFGAIYGINDPSLGYTVDLGQLASLLARMLPV